MSHPPGEGARGGRRLAAISVSSAAVVVAAAGYMVLVVAARVLGPAQYLEFAVFWAALYLAVGGVFGVQQEATRTIRSALTTDDDGARPIRAAYLVGGAVSLAIAISSWLWSSQVFAERGPLFVALIAIAVLLYTGHATLAGALGATYRWGQYSSLLMSEALGRLALVALAAAVATSLDALALASVAAMGVWLCFLLSKGARAALSRGGDATLRVMASRMANALLAAFASATLVTGFPIMLSLTASQFDPDRLAVAVLVITLTRAPILVPLNAFMSMILAHFVDRNDAGVTSLIRPIAFIVTGSVLLGVVASWLGNPLLIWFFGEPYRSEAWFVGAATAAAGLMGVLTVTGAYALSRRRHRRYLLGWFGAAAVTVALLLVPIELEVRIVLSLAFGPAIGAVLHCFSVRGAPRPRRAHRDAGYH